VTTVMMYNAERKERYIEAKEAITELPNNFLPRLFKQLSDYEEKLSKDACDFTETEICSYYKLRGSRSVNNLRNLNSQLSLYTDWCLGQGFVIDGQNHYRVLNQEDFEGCINLAAIQILSIGREDLIRQLRTLPNARERFVILYLFEVGSKDLVSIFKQMTLDWFDGEILHLPGRDVAISDELLQFAEEAAAERELVSYNATQKTFPLVPDGKVVQWRNNQRAEIVRMSQYSLICKRAMDWLGYGSLRPKEIELMGMKYMFEQLGKEYGLSITDAIFNKELFQRVMNQYGVSFPQRAFYNKIKGYL